MLTEKSLSSYSISMTIPPNNHPQRPKIGLALSGASGRAIAHIGILEVFRENNIPIDYISACSSGCVVAASFACGTMDKLKEDLLKLERKTLLDFFMLVKTSNGIFDLEKFGQWVAAYTNGKRLEEVAPRLGFVSADIVSGVPVLLSLGDIAKAAQASCAVPGLFRPVDWGGMRLVDGGLYHIVPTTQAKEMGADIVIGVDIAATRYMFSNKWYPIKKTYDALRNSLPARAYMKVHRAIDKILVSATRAQADTDPGVFALLDRALEITIANAEKYKGVISGYDLLLEPNVKHLGKISFKNSLMMLEDGRRIAMGALPKIRKLIDSKTL